MTDVLALQTSPTPAAAPSGSVSPISLAIIVVIVGGVLQYAGVDVLSYVPVIGSDGGGGGGARSTSSGGLLSGVGGFLTSLSGIAVIGLTLLSVLIFAGSVPVPEGTIVPIVVGLELTAAAVVLADLDALSVGLFAVVALATVVLGLSALGEPVIGAIADSPAFVLLVVGGLYLGYEAIQAYRAGQRTVVRVRGRVQRGQGGDDS